MFDALAYALGETFIYLVGRMLGRTFNIDRQRAQQLGEWSVLGCAVTALVVVTLVYS